MNTLDKCKSDVGCRSMPIPYGPVAELVMHESCARLHDGKSVPSAVHWVAGSTPAGITNY